MSLSVRHVAGMLACAYVPLAFGHGSERHGDFAALPWNWELWILVCMGVSIVGYACGVRLARARSRIFGGFRIASFAAGIGVLVIALISPFDALDDQLFSAHMGQHLLLMMVAAPLLVWSRPAMAFLWAFPLRARRAIGRAWTSTGLYGGVHALMSPAIVWVLCSFVLWFWHLPGPYGWALANESVHTLEHVCFFVTALMFWTLVLEPFGRRRLSYGATIIFVATLSVEMGMLGALLTFAAHPFYAGHFHTTAAWGLTPLEDQQLAGLIMWIPAGLIHLTTLSVLFIAWLRESGKAADRAVARARAARTSTRLALRAGIIFASALALVPLAGCQQRASPWQMDGANPARAPALMRHYGCTSCHVIPGIANARGRVGPSLAGFARRTYIAGTLTNSPDNLIRWLQSPQSVLPGNAMPNMNVTDTDARDMAAYLYTLQ